MKWIADRIYSSPTAASNSSRLFSVAEIGSLGSTHGSSLSTARRPSGSAQCPFLSRWILLLITAISFLCSQRSWAWDLKLQFDPSPTVPVSYHVYSAKSTDAFSLYATTSTTSFTMSGLLTGVVYRVYVTSFNTNGESTASNTITNSGPVIVPPPPTVPLPPSNLRSVAQFPNSINLHWDFDNISEPPATFFVIERATSSQPYEIAAVVPIDTRDGHDDNRKKNTVYYYRLYAANDTVHSGYSNVAAARTLQ